MESLIGPNQFREKEIRAPRRALEIAFGMAAIARDPFAIYFRQFRCTHKLKTCEGKQIEYGSGARTRCT